MDQWELDSDLIWDGFSLNTRGVFVRGEIWVLTGPDESLVGRFGHEAGVVPNEVVKDEVQRLVKASKPPLWLAAWRKLRELFAFLNNLGGG